MKSLSKKPPVDDNSQIKSFFTFFDNHIKSKIRILEQLVLLKKQSNKDEKSAKPSSTESIDISVLSKLNNSSIPQKTDLKILSPNSNTKEEAIKTVQNLLKCCEKNLKEIEETKKTLSGNNTIILDTTIINQNSFYIPNIPQQDSTKYAANGSLLKGSNMMNLEGQVILDKIEENLRVIYFKLCKMKSFYESENILKEKKKNKQEKLEKLKSTYSTMKKIYENAIRNGVKLH